MYLTIILLPLLSAFISGFMGRKIGIKGSQILSCLALTLASILATIAFYEVGLNESSISIVLFNWIDSESMQLSWAFLLDSLSVSMLLPVLWVSTAVHYYSIGYMEGDPHVQRFFSYLSLFTFFMLILVCGENFLIIFVGWEGSLKCLKWYNDNNSLIYSFAVLSGLADKRRSFLSSTEGGKIVSSKRIGPHNIDIISMIMGSVLGDSHLEKRKNGIGTRIIFEQSNKNVEYLMWFHSYLAINGYCNENPPKLHKRIKKDGIFFHYRINSYTFSSLNWIHDMFYKMNNEQNKLVKIVPSNIEDYLTPMALAIWFMDDGSKLGEGVKIATNDFSLSEIEFLCEILLKKYNLIVTIHKAGKNKGHVIYVNKISMPNFSKLIKPYMISSMYYKLGNY
jgi:hypothetical protein